MNIPEEKTPASFTKLLYYTVIPILEKVFAGILLLGLLLKYVNIDGKPFMIISLSGLAGVFYLTAFKPLGAELTAEEKQGFANLFATTMGPKLLGIGSAVLTIGILFYLMKFGGYKEMLMIGCGAVSLVLLGLGVVSLAGNKNIERLTPLLIRAIPLLLLGAYIFIKNF